MSLITRIFVWSLILEPMLFFIVFERSLVGITGNISRFLQALVILGLILRALLAKRIGVFIPVLKFVNPMHRIYCIYLLLAIFAGIMGWLMGSYDLVSEEYSLEQKSLFSNVLNSNMIRPFFEYVIAYYQFYYFVLLTTYFLDTEQKVCYYFSVFKKMFLLSMVVGFLDLALVYWEISYVPRHLSLDDWHFVGFRFHGLAGEPRDAFSYLLFGLSTLYLKALIENKSLSKAWVFVVVIAALLTQSTSGLLGIAMFMALYGIHSLKFMSLSRLFQLTIGGVGLLMLLYVAVNNTPRILNYINLMDDVWIALESNKELPLLLYGQSTNIFPLYDMLVKVKNGELLPILIGSGLGSTSIINQIYMGVNEFLNPHAQVVRVLFESGIIGSFLLVLAFTRPVKLLTTSVSAMQKKKLYLTMFLLIGCFLGHRSNAAFIYLGTMIAIFNIKYAHWE